MTGHTPSPQADGTRERERSPDRRARHAERMAELRAWYATLEELRHALGAPRRPDAGRPARKPPVDNMRVSALRSLVEAMGGELRLSARFADRVVELPARTEAPAAGVELR